MKIELEIEKLDFDVAAKVLMELGYDTLPEDRFNESDDYWCLLTEVRNEYGTDNVIYDGIFNMSRRINNAHFVKRILEENNEESN